MHGNEQQGRAPVEVFGHLERLVHDQAPLLTVAPVGVGVDHEPALAGAASQDLVILTRDGNLYVNDHERLALERYNHRVFWIGPKKGTGRDWADTFEAHHRAIARYARQPGPFVVKVQRGGLPTCERPGKKARGVPTGQTVMLWRRVGDSNPRGM